MVKLLTRMHLCFRCGNVAAILELDENLNKQFRVFEAAPQVCLSLAFIRLVERVAASIIDALCKV